VIEKIVEGEMMGRCRRELLRGMCRGGASQSFRAMNVGVGEIGGLLRKVGLRVHERVRKGERRLIVEGGDC
jgi:hypothetical protein